MTSRVLRDQGGFTLPFVLVMVALSLVAVSSVTFLAAHFRSIASEEDGERIYYAMDAKIESVMADLVRGADLLDPSYIPPVAEVNGLSPGLIVTEPGEAANPPPIQQYFDPGGRNPFLVSIDDDQRYLVHIFNVHPGVLQVNWAFDLVDTEEVDDESSDREGGDDRDKADGQKVEVILEVLVDIGKDRPGRANGCPSGALAALEKRKFDSPGAYSVSSGPIDITEPGIYSVAFCVAKLKNARLITRPFKPSGRLEDTWIYAIAYKDYKITAEVGDASLTAFVRQMPGPTQPPAGDWSDVNISWITNLITPYQWSR